MGIYLTIINIFLYFSVLSIFDYLLDLWLLCVPKAKHIKAYRWLFDLDLLFNFLNFFLLNIWHRECKNISSHSRLLAFFRLALCSKLIVFLLLLSVCILISAELIEAKEVH